VRLTELVALDSRLLWFVLQPWVCPSAAFQSMPLCASYAGPCRLTSVYSQAASGVEDDLGVRYMDVTDFLKHGVRIGSVPV
jgi:hypothetical protein